MQLLNVNSVFLGETLQYAGLVKLLAGTELLDYSGLFKLSLKLLQGAFDVLTVLYLYYNHFEFLLFCCYLICILLARCKIR